MRITQGTFSFLPELTDAEIKAQIQYAIDQGWACSVEYTDDPHPRNTYWEMYGLPMFGLFEALVFVFFFGPDRGWNELHLGSSLRLPRLFKYVAVYVTPVFLLTILVGWLATDGWKTILMKKMVDGRLAPLYTETQMPWVIATRLLYLAFIAFACLLIRRAWRFRATHWQETRP